ncbi:MAG: heavy-metal-associated domain-containing protein [Candidatus Babeliaceae bacterium]
MLTLMITVTGCGKLHKKKQLPRTEITHSLTISVEGVECERCAQDVTLALKKVPDVTHVEFIVKNGNYEQGHFAITHVHKDQNLEKNIQAAVKKEGFAILKK